MKELSEEKAIDVVRQMVADGQVSQDIAEKYFPELKESEDEKIRKEMIEILEKEARDFPSSVIAEKSNSWIAWLEKQCEHANFRNNIQIGDKVTRNEDGVLVNLSQLKRIAKPAENKGKNNMGISEATKQKLEDNLNKALEKETPESWNKFLDEQGEQKPTDKVKPKFKVGDFIVNDYCMGKVIELTNDAYLLDTGQGIPFSHEHNAHLWTLEDAKDGDVLYFSDETIVIFKDLYNATTFHSYCHIEDGEFGISCEALPDWWEGKEFQPATTEQRDLFFQKMKEAGWEWDAEKKELKKIEEKKDIHNKLTAFEFSLKHIIEEAIECGDIHNLKADADLLLRIARKTSWSEEDEEMVDDIIEAIDTQYAVTDYNEMVTWLKSLKERYVWKPSDEQMKALQIAIGIVGELTPTASLLKEIREQLKKLMENAIDVTVHIEAGNYPYIPQMELYDYDKDIPLAKEGDKYKVVLIKED